MSDRLEPAEAPELVTLLAAGRPERVLRFMREADSAQLRAELARALAGAALPAAAASTLLEALRLHAATGRPVRSSLARSLATGGGR